MISPALFDSSDFGDASFVSKFWWSGKPTPGRIGPVPLQPRELDLYLKRASGPNMPLPWLLTAAKGSPRFACFCSASKSLVSLESYACRLVQTANPGPSDQCTINVQSNCGAVRGKTETDSEISTFGRTDRRVIRLQWTRRRVKSPQYRQIGMNSSDSE